MRVLIYHPNSFGGTYDYALQLLEAYDRQPQVSEVTLLLPRNATVEDARIQKILEHDLPKGSAWHQKLNFLHRIVRNPLRLWQLAGKQQEPTLVVFNEFEQLTAPFWAPLFRRWLPRGHRLAVVLHDPDRDAYPPSPPVARWTMRQVMKTMHLGLYHEVLPERPYYRPNGRTRYLSVPHGVFPFASPDEAFRKQLRAWVGPQALMALVGNIRLEKNYGMAIDLLADFPQLHLVVAGRPANSGVRTEPLKKQAQQLGVASRIWWEEKFVPDAVFSAVLAEADVVWLNYSATFRSMSAVLNQLAHFRTPVLASRGKSALALLVERFGLGSLTQPDDTESARVGLHQLLEGGGRSQADWEGYLAYATWDRHVGLVLDALSSEKHFTG